MKDALVSVIIPVYNVEKYLDRCIESVVNQTYQNLEIILVEDGSPDNCSQKCDGWALRDSRIKVIHKENGGLSDARNAGLETVNGELISFVDSDDWLAPEFYERLISAMEKDSSDIAACSVEMVWENEENKNRLLTVHSNCVLDRLEAQKQLLIERMLKHPVWYKLYRRNIIKNVYFEVDKFHEDVFWSYQVIGNANRVTLVDYIGYFYRQRPESIMGRDYSFHRLDALEAYERQYRYIAKSFPELETQARINVVTNCIFHGQMVLKYLHGNEKREAFDYLNSIKGRYPIKRREYRSMKTTHRLWLDLARLSLKLSCKIKNKFGVGF